MTNKYMYFIANWKMFGDLRTLNSLDSVIKFSKNIKIPSLELFIVHPILLYVHYQKG
jgi:triosephosphate isomerase